MRTRKGRAYDGGDSRCDCTSFVKEENVGQRHWRQALPSPCSNSHDNACNQEIGILRRNTAPHSCDDIYRKSHHIDPPAAVLVDQRHPHEITETLEQSRAVEEVGRLRNGCVDARLLPIGEEGLRGLYDGQSWACGEEVTHDHRKTHGNGRVELEGSGPSRSVRQSIS